MAIDETKVTVLSRGLLNDEETADLERLILESYKDPALLSGDEAQLSDENRRCVVLYEDTVVGFYSPVTVLINGEHHWRSGTPYIGSEHRGKGIMEVVLKDFFASHLPAVAWIRDTNASSIRLYTKLGFVQGEKKDYRDEKGHWYFKQEEPAFLKWK